MKNHTAIMQAYFLFEEELQRKETFRKSMEGTFREFEFNEIKNIFEIEEKTDKVLKNSLTILITQSMKRTDLYYFLEKEDVGALQSLLESNEFKYELYYINEYCNVITDMANKFWVITPAVENVASLLIEKAMEYSSEKTKKVCQAISKWNKTWEPFIDKQMLFYTLSENLTEKHKVTVKI